MNLTFDWGGPELIDSKMFYAPDSICSVRAFEVQGHLKIEKKKLLVLTFQGVKTKLITV